MWIVGGLLLAALLIIAWVIAPTFRRRYAFNVPSSYPREASAAVPALFKPRTTTASPKKNALPGNGFIGGPRQVSLQLKPSKPSLRHAAMPLSQLQCRC